MSVGSPEMDGHHRRIFQLINRLAKARDKASGEETVSEVIGELMKYSSDHLAAEEALLDRIGFPELDAHKELHKDYRLTLATMALQALESGTPSVDKVIGFLRTWWTNHIQVEDMKYKSHALRSRGVGE